MGIDDTPVTSTVTTAFGSGIPLMIVPAMHVSMFNHPILQENIKKLEDRGVKFIGPRLEEGKAKIASVSEIIENVLQKLGTNQDLAKKHILITAGPTLEYIDPGRRSTSKSSGRMGVEIARAAYERGATVTLVYGHGSATPPIGIKLISVETTQEMHDTVIRELESKKIDVVVAAAAVADWTPTRPRREKVPTEKTPSLTVTFKPTPKIVDAIKKIQQTVFLVLFKAEHKVSDKKLVTRAYQRLTQAKADLIVANDVGRPGVGFGTKTNELFVIDNEKRILHIPKTTKSKAAHLLLDIIVKGLASK
ncbi:MAG: bifunctional phosphopantothenoylcysteine decarboxylase/phosphopantothenate--cysteine ligase CoaBC, partial [Candidatus Thorarchaeota archaeon]